MNITKVAELEKTESFEIEYRGQTVKCEAFASGWTPGILSDLNDRRQYPSALLRIVKSWDVTTDDNGTKFPLELGPLENLPTDFYEAIFNKVTDSYSGDKKKPQS
jgi:hypothetical protein